MIHHGRGETQCLCPRPHKHDSQLGREVLYSISILANLDYQNGYGTSMTGNDYCWGHTWACMTQGRGTAHGDAPAILLIIQTRDEKETLHIERQTGGVNGPGDPRGGGKQVSD